MGWSLSVGKTERFMKIQLKIQDLCPPSHCPKMSSGPDWSLWQSWRLMFETKYEIGVKIGEFWY